MSKIDLKDISIITFVKLDTEERIENIRIRTDYLRYNCTNIETIFIEEDNEPKLLNHIKLGDNDKYIFYKTDTQWNKCRAYNNGVKLSTRDVLCFLDIDIIIDTNAFIETVEQLNKQDALIYPFDGRFLCVSKDIKKSFNSSLHYELLKNIIPEQSHVINYKDKNILVGHNNSVGACVMTTKNLFQKFNGYNPGFIGWGYEDNELPKRVHILGHQVGRLNSKYPAFHLPHDGVGQDVKQFNPYYEQNKLLCQKIETSTKEELEKAIKEWSI